MIELYVPYKRFDIVHDKRNDNWTHLIQHNLEHLQVFEVVLLEVSSYQVLGMINIPHIRIMCTIQKFYIVSDKMNDNGIHLVHHNLNHLIQWISLMIELCVLYKCFILCMTKEMTIELTSCNTTLNTWYDEYPGVTLTEKR